MILCLRNEKFLNVKASEASWLDLDRVIGRAQGVDKAVELPVFCVIKVMAALAAVISRTNGPEARRSPSTTPSPTHATGRSARFASFSFFNERQHAC